VFGNTFYLADYHPVADGVTDDTPALQQLFNTVAAKGGGVVTIPPGNYFVKGEKTLPVSSNTTVFAYGANFYLPEKLGDQARIVLFKGTDVTNFSWFGANFKGYCFDPGVENNTWEPNVNTRIFVIQSSKTGKTDQILFRDVCSSKIAGAVIHVAGYTDKESTAESTAINFATNITVENCTLLESGRFMWDYGFLWEILVFPEVHTPAEQKIAQKYFLKEYIRENLKIDNGSDKVYINNVKNPLPISSSDTPNQVLCFYNDILPQNIVRGKQYYIVESTPEYIKVSDSFQGRPIVFDGAAGTNAKLIYNIEHVFYSLFSPIGSGPGKGSIDLVRCRNTKISDCTISAQGDAMHVFCCHNNLIANNKILGARMGAFFLAEYSKNSTITGNTVDGTNGSRVLSIERSNEDVTVTSNIFRNGGRGSWINQPQNLVIHGNLFINNTNKNSRNENGRRDFKTGEWVTFPEMYFTTYQKDAKYGPVILSNNIFITGKEASAALHFQKNAQNILVHGNTFTGGTTVIMMDKDDGSIDITNNRGAVIKKGTIHSISND
jgi:hypothetical protein